MSADLLVELLTEELPPKALKRLGEAFAEGIASGLAARGLVEAGARRNVYATPRRLAVCIEGVIERGADRTETRKLMPVKVAYGADGNPSAALQKRLEKDGAAASDVQRRTEGGTEYAFLNQNIAGVTLAEGLQAALADAVAKLPIPKTMGYQLADGATTVEFVRPAHGLVALHGEKIVGVSVLGMQAGRVTHGHRFQGVRDIEIKTAAAYEEALAAHGRVIASFEERRADTEVQLRALAAEQKSSLGPEADVSALLDEVTALVEYPSVYVGQFESDFLVVPQECLVLTMRTNQKYFPLFDAGGKLTNRFLIVSNMRLEDPKNIIEGNQRVVRPRLADARFFFETDKKTKLADRVPLLAHVTYHNKLGSQQERNERVRSLAKAIARHIGADTALADRAALLAKADLVTNMVGEFPELQGVMGRYYALADGEDERVANAIGDQYRIRLDADRDSASPVSMSLFVADRIETLVGIWGIGLQPTGDKDPFGLRRAALGVISAFELLGAAAGVSGSATSLRLAELLELGATLFRPGSVVVKDLVPALTGFVYERYRNQLNATFDRGAVDAVIAIQPPLHEIVRRVRAVVEFGKLPEAAALAAANKRIGNILKKADSSASAIDPVLFAEPAEKALAAVVTRIVPEANRRFAESDYAGTLMLLAQAKQPVDAFFNEVMVMAEDPVLRANRIALLRELHGLMNRVADISRLAA